MSSLSASSPPDDTFKILVATDIHLGYAENDPVRGEDSFNTFEEILELAKANDVDFILLGGDLFHDNKPSTLCMFKCMALLRKYCMGERPISVEFMSDPNVNFQHCYERLVNYEDPNLNISIPVFSIHGNHDDPTGSIQISSLDILSVSGLVNYFGKWTDLTDVKVSPMLLRKGASKLAIYGLSHIKDERLARLFRSNSVQFFQPSESTNEWFNIFVCHQNRVDRGIAKYVQETALPEIMDLVIWGHEHECKLLDETWNPIKEFHVIQPGSSVATSLCEGEARKKHVALLRVHDKKFKIDHLPLKTVRPFIFETIKLSECNIRDVDPNPADNVQRYLTERVDYSIVNASDQITGHPKQPTLPLIRIRVEYVDELQCFNTIRFGQQFQSKVANPTDMIKLFREKPKERKAREGLDIEGKENMEEFLENEEVEDLWEIKMNAIIAKYFNEVNTAKQMQVLSIRGISEAAARYIDKGDRDAIERIFQHQRNKIQKYLLDENIPLENLDEAIAKYREDRKQNPVIEAEENKKVFSDDFGVGGASTSNNGGDALQMHISDDSDDGFNTTAPPATTTSQRGRGSRGGRGRAAAAPKAPSTRGRGSRGGRARGTASASSTVTLTTTVQKTQSQRPTRASTSTSNQNSKLNRLRYDDSDSD
ncbi:double-strand break repair protein MRE11 [Planococcus citri]|uniref:double-strand break repair protein MRE11 n=1 Tax=Planococcus citri TaxID=170843 RepID=UPI0031FA19A0